jgi:phosphoribosylformimino-5-aminoimidazole carboxamide ribotide isomerase
MGGFTIYPAIDLRKGQVVRLKQGDPNRQTTYAADPAQVAARWLEAGARWLHVVNLDGAFGEADQENQSALKAILKEASPHDARVQFGGGLRSLEGMEKALHLGVHRLVLGTVALEMPELLAQAVKAFQPGKVVVGLDALQGTVRTHGWSQGSNKAVLPVGKALADLGVRTVIYTDIQRDGMQAGADIPKAQDLAGLGLEVIASGGVRSLEDILQVRQAGLSGVIIGRALYEGAFRLEEALELERS